MVAEANDAVVEAHTCPEAKGTTMADMRGHVGATLVKVADARAAGARKTVLRQEGTAAEETESSTTTPTSVMEAVADMTASVVHPNLMERGAKACTGLNSAEDPDLRTETEEDESDDGSWTDDRGIECLTDADQEVDELQTRSSYQWRRTGDRSHRCVRMAGNTVRNVASIQHKDCWKNTVTTY
ncbi:unnamed protein product [Phytophthora fragariaefolia]|uniref:Unnamed protein product n=1 Tax=Phytophthora fragariaefolia TaxID=1490495 RepID=A0A9W7D0T2_9STRA|nr:unnamed protein product [Phytophthora fragariaefolia]